MAPHIQCRGTRILAGLSTTNLELNYYKVRGALKNKQERIRSNKLGPYDLKSSPSFRSSSILGWHIKGIGLSLAWVLALQWVDVQAVNWQQRIYGVIGQLSDDSTMEPWISRPSSNIFPQKIGTSGLHSSQSAFKHLTDNNVRGH